MGGRLQYTIRCIEALARQVGAPPFEVVVVDNGTVDGTREWFAAMHQDEAARAYFPPIRYVCPEKNLGDWGGMVYGAQHVSPKVGIIGQLDNDIELPPTTLTMCAGVISAKMARVVMIKRRGVLRTIHTKGKSVRRTVNSTPFGLQPVPFCVAFWLTAARNFENVANHRNCRQFTASIGACHKILALQALHMEGWEIDGPRTYTQKRKYDLHKWQLAKKRGIVL